MQLRGQFFHVDENCNIFKHLKQGEACFFKSTCDAICELNDGTAEYRKLRDELDFRAFPEAWKKKEHQILLEVAKLIKRLEEKGVSLDAKRIKNAYGFDPAKKITTQIPGK